MSKVLVIKGASFSTDAIEKVNLIGNIPCTSITLSKQSTSFSSDNITETITATVTPSNTTDVIVWSTSNENVATVTNGVIKSIGVGNATITAKCGTKTDTCSVSVTETLSFYKGYSTLLTASASTMRETTTLSSNSKYLTVCKDSGLYPISYNTLGVTADNCYPISIPNGSTKVKITCPNLSILYALYDKNSVGTVITSNARTHSKAVDGIIASGGTQYSISAWTTGYMEIDLSSKPASANAISLSLYNDSASVITNYDTSQIKIEFE